MFWSRFTAKYQHKELTINPEEIHFNLAGCY